MKVIAKKTGIYGSDRIRKGQSFEIPDGEELRSWVIPAESYSSEDGEKVEYNSPQTLGELAEPVPEVLRVESGKKSGKKFGR